MSTTSVFHGPHALVTVEDREQDVARRRHTLTRRRRARSLLWMFVALMVGGLTFLGATGAGGQSAQAIDLFCVENNSNNSPSPYGAGTDAIVPHIDPRDGLLASGGFNAAGTAYGNTPVTAYEWFGGAGMAFSSYYGDKGDRGDPCFPVSEVMSNFIANSVFAFTTMIIGLVIGLFQWASAPSLLHDFLTPITQMIQGQGGSGGLRDQLFLPFFTPLIMIGALWMGWKGLVKSRTTEAFQGAIWMICAGAFALFFMAQPTLIAEWSDNVVSSVTAAATTATTSTVAKSTPAGDVCYLPDAAVNAGPRVASCAIWKAMLFTPWATGQFGVPPSTEITSAAITTKVGDRTMTDLRVAQIDAQSFNHDQSLSSADMSALRKGKLDKWEQILDAGTTQSWWSSWNGSNAGQRVSLSSAALLAALIGGSLIALIAFTILTLQLFNLLLILTGPLFLLIGVHPGFGRKIGLKWLELVVSTLLKRLVLGFMLAVLIAMYQIILTAPMAWFAQVVMIFAVGVGFFMFRKPMLEAFSQSVNFGGQSIGSGANPKQQAKKAVNQGVGGVAGAIGAKKAGGGLSGILQGAAQGGSRGGRSASVLRAASIGGSAGKTQGYQSAGAKDKRAKDAEAKKAAKEEAPNDWDGAGVTGTDSGSDGSGYENDEAPASAGAKNGIPRPGGFPGPDGDASNAGNAGNAGNAPRPDLVPVPVQPWHGGSLGGASAGNTGPSSPRPAHEQQQEQSAASEDADNRDRAQRRDADDLERSQRRDADTRERKDREARETKQWREQQETVRTSTLPSDQLRRSREAAAANAAAAGAAAGAGAGAGAGGRSSGKVPSVQRPEST